MRERDKLLLVILGTTLLLAGIFYVSGLYDLRNSPLNFNNQNNSNNSASENDSFARLQGIQPTKTRDLLYSDITFLELPIYPTAWVERNFEVSEEVNELVSGPAADPDNDGLINKEEYFYGSDPKDANSLCINVAAGCDRPNDGEAVARNISPLTGLELITPKRFSIKKQDYAIINRIEESFETASAEGVDFPTLYQLSRQIDLGDELEAIPVNGTENDRDTVTDYINVRVDIIETYSEENEISNFIELYETSNVDELLAIKQEYINLENNFQNNFVPAQFVETHQAYVLLFQKFQELVDIRVAGLQNPDLNLDEYRAVSQEKATELVWVYRYISEAEERLSKNKEDSTTFEEREAIELGEPVIVPDPGLEAQPGEEPLE